MLARSPGVASSPAVPPATERALYTYRVHLVDGSGAGEATYSVMIQPGEEILIGNGRRFCVLAVVPFEEEDESPFVGRLQVEAV
jgi:hypothetical protein